MKTITIKTREVLVRTGFKHYPYKPHLEYIVEYDGKSVTNSQVTESNAKVPFKTVLKTRSYRSVVDFCKSLSRKMDDLRLKAEIALILPGETELNSK